MKLLRGEGTQAQQDVVCANAALAIATKLDCDLTTAYQKATDSLFGGHALKAFETLQKLSTT
jgi:anthranilate phosphoribosyltransferase